MGMRLILVRLVPTSARGGKGGEDHPCAARTRIDSASSSASPDCRALVNSRRAGDDARDRASCNGHGRWPMVAPGGGVERYAAL
eukprot:1283717-Prymnesium_polylepis.1